jgi:hypothetical protein
MSRREKHQLAPAGCADHEVCGSVSTNRSYANGAPYLLDFVKLNERCITEAVDRPILGRCSVRSRSAVRYVQPHARRR